MIDLSERRAIYSKALNRSLEIFVSEDEEDINAVMSKGLQPVSEAVNLDRIVVYRLLNINSKKCFGQVYRWVKDEGGTSTIDNELRILPNNPAIEKWIETCSGGGYINVHTSIMSAEESAFLNFFGVKSMMLAPVFTKGGFWGGVAFQDHKTEREFDEDTVEFLFSAARVCANAFIHDEMKREITAEKNLIREMIDSASIGVAILDENLVVIDCNDAIIDIFGGITKQYYSEHFFDLSPEHQPDGLKSVDKGENVLRRALNGEKIVLEWTHRSILGEHIPCEVTLTRVKYNDKYNVLAYIYDLRNIKAIEKSRENLRMARDAAEAANKTKTIFLANMSHEMRTPMNAIVGLTGLLLEEDSTPGNIKETLKKINTAGDTLMGLINDVLDISKIEAGKFELLPVQYDVPSLLNDIITLNMIRIEDKPITFKLDINEDMPCSLFGDDLRIKQILNNLLSNAFKYTEEGTVTLGVSCSHEGADADTKEVWFSFYVNDTGIGIRKENLERLFDDYIQVDAQANRTIKGTGLGLSITKKFVELMGGKITVESKYCEGTTFRGRIRQGFVDNKSIGKETVDHLCNFRYSDNKKLAHEKVVRPNLSYARVLLVDDFPTNLDVAEGMLRKYKMHVDCVTNGYDAIKHITAGDPVYDAVFMDHMMPEMDGMEATKAIRALGTEYAQNIPIIALTANAIAGNEQMFLENGFNAFLPKPFNAMLLDSIVQRWVRDKSKE